MKIITLSIMGIDTAYAQKRRGATGAYYYALVHGKSGKGQWQVRYPLAIRDFPCDEASPERLCLDGYYEPVDLKRNDAQGNPEYWITSGVEDGAIIVLWSLSPGEGGGATFRIEGAACCIALGYEAQGDAGCMRSTPCPIIIATGPCTLTWHRTGQLHGSPPDWTATFDGEQWIVKPTSGG